MEAIQFLLLLSLIWAVYRDTRLMKHREDLAALRSYYDVQVKIHQDNYLNTREEAAYYKAECARLAKELLAEQAAKQAKELTT